MCGVCTGVCGCALVCAGVCGCVRVSSGVLKCSRVCAGVHGCAQEYLLETRFNTSADFNTYPMRIFLFCSYSSLSLLFFFSFTSSLLHPFCINSSSSKYLLVTPLVLKSYRRPCSYVVQCILL